MILSLKQAQNIALRTLKAGAEKGLKPLCVAVLDPGGHTIVLHRADGASHLRPAIAIAKAAGALNLGVSSRSIAAIAAERPTFFNSLVGIAPLGMVPAAGGVIVVDSDGQTLGAVGVTGDTSDNDEACALAGIEEANLFAKD
ncbi:heme-binding protein [Sphingobium sp. WTD-1]|uniref:GlcG/HbpS family heme-binding protein n=1 Tax=Sphingomonadales TaxID=204457 RepID=UPI0012BB2DC9|nr:MULTISPECIES: heme-binding protein [Sphingomonadaceae]QGP77758.1 heme-binding protein [Sphingobium sp. CAP-1]QKR98452.1 heme-binding protein [Sphingomonas sp. CL5.1]WIA57774.1 heme-binding protein [Sphingobium sp. WTD-1]|tara:strand:- start:21694 stop:22119 length:426 start_codon:yes stop_codon:yes gene_type:complete